MLGKIITDLLISAECKTKAKKKIVSLSYSSQIHGFHMVYFLALKEMNV